MHSNEQLRNLRPVPTGVVRTLGMCWVLLSCIAVGACADAAVTEPAAVAAPASSGPSLTTYDATTKTLGTTITSGVNKYRTEGGYQVGSTVTGGTGPYYYIWYIARSSSGGASDFQLYDKGWGMTGIDFYVYPDDMQIIIKLSVGDSQVPTWTGNYSRSFLGPAAVTVAPAGCQPAGDPGAPHFDNFTAPDFQHKSTYYNEVCGWTRVYDHI